jgi:cobalt-zinc-cadmium efflux system outer membrane protein
LDSNNGLTRNLSRKGAALVFAAKEGNDMALRWVLRNGHAVGKGAVVLPSSARMIVLAVTIGGIAAGAWGRAPAQEPTLGAPVPMPTFGSPGDAQRARSEPSLVRGRNRTVVRPVSALELREPDEPKPVPARLPPVGLTLDEAIQRCLLNDPQIRAGLEAVRQAQADWRTASLPPNPEVTVGVALLPLSRRFTVDEPGGPTEFDVGFSYPVDWFLFGKRAAAMASACLGIRVSEAEYADLVRQRVTEAALAFYDVLEAKALRGVARQDVKNLERVEAVTRTAVENGGRPQVELNRVRLELLIARRGQREAETALVNATAALRALLGEAAADPGFDVAGTLDGPLTAEPQSVEEVYSLAIETRPDILALRRKVGRAQADVVLEDRNARPEVTPDFGIGHQFQQSIGAPDVTAWGTGIAVTVPLFNRNQGNRAKAASVVSQSNYELQAGLVELHAEVQQAVQALRTARQDAASVAQEELQLAAEVRDSIRQAYEAGGRPLIEVLDAQRNYRETYRTYVSSRAEYWRALQRYHAALGQQVTAEPTP